MCCYGHGNIEGFEEISISKNDREWRGVCVSPFFLVFHHGGHRVFSDIVLNSSSRSLFFSSICHPEEHRDEGSRVHPLVFPPIIPYGLINNKGSDKNKCQKNQHALTS